MYIYFGWGGVSYCYLGPCIQKIVYIPVVTIFPPISHDFFYNIKYSLLKLFCTILCLCEGTPLQQLWLHFFWSTLPCVPELTIAISQVLRAGQHNKGKFTYPMISLLFPTFSPELYFSHALTFYLYPSKESSISVPIHSASLRATGLTFPLCQYRRKNKVIE